MIQKCYIDTNVIVRFFIKDIPEQFDVARDFFEAIEANEKIGLISVLVINEVIWILEHFYELKRAQYIDQFLTLLSLPNIRIVEMDKDALSLILQKMKTTRIDFTDIYLWQLAKKDEILSFDQDFGKLAR